MGSNAIDDGLNRDEIERDEQAESMASGDKDAAYSPLLCDNWSRIDKRSLDDCRSDEWRVLDRQKRAYLDARCADEVLRLLEIQAHDPSFGYSINMYRHCLQTATLMLADELPEEDVVVGLLHDVGYMVCPEAHGDFAALLLRPYISDRNHWMLQHHEVFQQYHFHDMPGVDRHERDRWSGHPFFEWTATFVAQYDQVAINADADILPLETFAPMVRRVLATERERQLP